jgi:hypothetical protein
LGTKVCSRISLGGARVGLRSRSRIGLRGALAALALLAACLATAGCGSSKPPGTNADPAGLAPAASALYIGAVLRPEGALRQDALHDAKTLAHERQPFEALLQALAGSGPLGRAGYASEVKPWLGRNGGAFALGSGALEGASRALGQSLGTGLSPEALLRAAAAGLLSGGKGTAAALVLDTSDVNKARAFVAKLAGRQGARQVAHRGFAFFVDAQGQAEGIVGRFAVFGDEAGLKAAIDTHLGAPSLKSPSSPQATLAGKGPGRAFASIYLNPAAAARPSAAPRASGRSGSVGATPQAGAAAQAASFLQALPGEPKQVRLSFVPQSSAIAVYADLLGSAAAESKATAAAEAVASLVGGLPASSWLALSAPEAGAHVTSYLALLDGIVSLESRSLLAGFGGPALQGLLSRLAQNGAQLQRLFAGWTGPAAAFASGSGLLSIQAGLVVQAPSTAAASAAASRLGALLSAAGASVSSTSIPGAQPAFAVRVTGLPVTLDLGAGEGKLVVGLGPASVQGALAPTSTLSSSSAYASASSLLGGGKPIAVVQFPMALALLEGLGLGESPSLSPTLTSLRALGTLAGDVQPLGGGVMRLRLVLSLNGSSGGGSSEG